MSVTNVGQPASGHIHPPPDTFIKKFVFSLDHKVIAVQYFITGGLFFVPSATFLDNVTADESPAAMAPGSSAVGRVPSDLPVSDGSLRIGSLKGKHEHE